MTVADLISRAQAAGLTLWREGDRLKYRGSTEAVNTLLPDLRDFIREHRVELLAALAADPLPDPRAQARRRRVLAMLEAHPAARYALVSDEEAEPEAVILTLAIRGQATCDIRIPREKYDGTLLLDLIERHAGTVH